ncbi:MAG: class I SAM-dependent methyltransferase [Bacteroidales bacterium]|nr:class I SAM-dependent methyltransferase [Bacteroidales bacterium]
MNCRICNSDKLILFFTVGDKNQYKFYKCRKCGLVNLDLEGLNIAENQGKYFAGFKPIDNYEDQYDARLTYNAIKKYVPVKGNFLDIGCGNGAVLYFARKDGWKVKGLEISPDYANYLRDTLKMEVHVADFMEFENTGEKYDAVALRHVLEHLPDSILALNKISKLLKNRGYGIFEFPNINSVSHRFQRFLNKTGLHRKKFSPSFRPGHCNEFSRRTFKYLLKLTNFELIRWETYSYKPLTNFIYNRINIGTKARAIVRKKG